MCVNFFLHSFHSLSIYNTIRVEHGDDLEDVGLSQAGCQWAGAHQELQRALHYPTGVGLSRVHSGRQEDQWTIPWRLRKRDHSTSINRAIKETDSFTAKKNSVSELQWMEKPIWEALACPDLLMQYYSP